MRKKGNVVYISESDIETFGNSWPCCGLRCGDTLAVEFAANGDLVDYTYKNQGRLADVERVDGGALSAIIDDARAYLVGNKREPGSAQPY